MSLSDSRIEPNLSIAPPETGLLRLRLRAATADLHARLDERLGALELSLLADYRRFLEASAAALLPIESALESAGVRRFFSDWPRRSRRRAICEDLDRIGGRVAPLRFDGALDLGGMLGAMYVLEGSRLGAQILIREVERSPDPLVSGTTAYLAHGAGERYWPTFVATLEACASAADEMSAIAGAQRAFDLFDRAAASA